MAVVEGPAAATRLAALRAEPGLRPRPWPSAEARAALARGRVVLVVSAGEPPAYTYDPTQPESRAARLAVDAALQRAAGRADAFTPGAVEITEPGARYVDFLVPGPAGHEPDGDRHVGRRLLAGRGPQRQAAEAPGRGAREALAPARRPAPLAADLPRPRGGRPARLRLLPAGRAAARLAAVALACVSLLGALAFTGLGLLTAARPRTIEGVSGLMNLVMVPMWVFSGIFFSTERFPAAIQPFVQALPLTALNDALRAVMLDGAGLVGRWPRSC